MLTTERMLLQSRLGKFIRKEFKNSRLLIDKIITNINNSGSSDLDALNQIYYPSDTLAGLFCWQDTPEGRKYWKDIQIKMQSKESFAEKKWGT